MSRAQAPIAWAGWGALATSRVPLRRLGELLLYSSSLVLAGRGDSLSRETRLALRHLIPAFL